MHERALRVLLGDYESTFEFLLTKNNEIAIHTKNLQKLMTEVYKSLNQGSPSFMGEFFVQRELTYDLRIKNTLQILPTKMISSGIKSLGEQLSGIPCLIQYRVLKTYSDLRKA